MPPKDVSEPGTTLPAADSSAAPDQPEASNGASDVTGDQSASTSVSEPQKESAQSKDWLGDAMRAVRSSQYARPSKEAPPASDDTPESKDGDGEKPAAKAASAEDRKPGASQDASRQTSPDQFTLSREELERRIQSETDRRLHKFQEEQALLRKKAERAELRKKDPYAYAELEEEEEERQQQLQRQMSEARTLAINSLRAYDTAVLDPLFGLLPEKERKDILEKIEDGIAGRGKAAATAFKVLERTWKQAGIAEARKALLNDQAFVKEVFAKYGNGGRVEPDLVPAAGAATPGDGGFSMNRWIREAAGRRVS
jgi:hypothetical protein